MMNENNFEGAEITVYTKGGDTITLDLSKTQLFIVFKILGIDFKPGGLYTCHSDQGLEEFLNMKTNPLRLIKKDQ